MVNKCLLHNNILNRILLLSNGRTVHSKKINTIHKRASMLENMIKDRDKRKTWHFEILQNQAKAKNVFENVSRPSKRQNVLNVLFVQNITDVLSTGDAAQEILDCGVEITGVKVSPCCQLVNVYWQIPPSRYSSNDEIGLILNKNASKIRAELISRNVMGRVPRIFFVRDTTNAYIAAFEKAMQEIDLGPDKDTSVVPDDSFLESLYEFKDTKAEKDIKTKETPTETSKDIAKANNAIPQKPTDMRTDIFGLNQDKLMSQVLATKMKSKFTPSNNVILTSIGDINADLFTKIPGTPFYEDVNREELLRKFHIDRKKLRNRRVSFEGEEFPIFADSVTGEAEADPETFEEDYFEEETAERF